MRMTRRSPSSAEPAPGASMTAGIVRSAIAAPLVRAQWSTVRGQWTNARGSMRCPCQGEPAPRHCGQDDLGRLRRRAREPCTLCRPIRWLPCRRAIVRHWFKNNGERLRLQDLPRALRQEPLLRGRPRHAEGVPAARPGVLSRSAPVPTGWSAGRTARSSAGTIGSSAAPRRSTTRSTTSRFWRANLVLCAVSHEVATGSRPVANAPFKEWDLPSALRRVQRKLERQPGGDRQMVDILGAVLTDGLDAVEAACAEALSHNVHSAGVVLNILARRHARGVRPARRAAATADDRDAGCVAPEARVPRDSWAASLRPIATAMTA